MIAIDMIVIGVIVGRDWVWICCMDCVGAGVNHNDRSNCVGINTQINEGTYV